MSSLPPLDQLRRGAQGAASACGVPAEISDGPEPVVSPILGEPIAGVALAPPDGADTVVRRAAEAFHAWRLVPAPRRGDVVRRLGELLREHKTDLARLVTLETGKITSEAAGEVQEMIDVCDFAVGLSRQLYGRTMTSERAGHRLTETWHPLGVVGVISAFNFPVAVWSWNTTIALVCGDTVVWKPSERGRLSALACDALLRRALREASAPDGVHELVLGDRTAGAALVDHPDVALISATGSTAMGRVVGPRVASRFGRSLLELGGNNAAVVTPSADLDLAVRGIVFAAAGTAGQRCTTMRRLIVHRSRRDDLLERLRAAYAQLRVGDPGDPDTLVGPLISREAWKGMDAALAAGQDSGGELVAGGGRVYEDAAPGAYYVQPSVLSMPTQTPSMRQETFAPLLHVLAYDDLDEAIALNNDVPQGLSSSIFTGDLAEAERFVASDGSDCGIVNVNIGTSGAEIGGAFGGEKETGGGRESGTDSWRGYMRRVTSTVNYSGELPFAQGVDFSLREQARFT